MNKNKVELLAPAGDLERAYFAFNYGADAIYLGAKQYSLRARASNFEISDIQEIVNYAHIHHKKVYIVANIICHNIQLQNFKPFFDQLVKINVDGFIVADPFIFYELKKHYPHVELHVSTQQSITNSKAAAFWKNNGATRVVLARELKYDEIKQLTINNNHFVEIEMFIHGAVCIAYSGRCMMSNNFSLRDANVGGCAQSCRWEYDVLNDSHDNHFFTMSAKDMVYLKHLDKLLNLDIDSFKIEGRMKTVNYLTTVIKTYREAIDEFYEKQHILDYDQYETKLNVVANRPTDDAFLFDANADKMLYHDEQKKLQQDYLFNFIKQIDANTYLIKSRNYFDINTKIKILSPKGEDVKLKIVKIWDEQNNELSTVNTPMTICYIKFNMQTNFNEYCIGKADYEK